jgi:hypothetical protein
VEEDGKNGDEEVTFLLTDCLSYFPLPTVESPVCVEIIFLLVYIEVYPYFSHGGKNT